MGTRTSAVTIPPGRIAVERRIQSASPARRPRIISIDKNHHTLLHACVVRHERSLRLQVLNYLGKLGEQLTLLLVESRLGQDINIGQRLQ